VLAAWWPDSSWWLLDANDRRTAFLRDAVAELGWAERVLVVRARAEDAARDPELRGSMALVTSRSFGKPAVTAECAAGFLAVGGRLVVSEPPDGDVDDPAATRWPAHGLAAFGLAPIRRQDGCQVLAQVAPCPEDVPRRTGVPAKRPRF
jgi:16S rRNA (guanine527-N7)-methyltransferase